VKLRSKLVGVLLVPVLVLVACNAHAQTQAPREGRDASEAFWGDTLQLHRAIAGEKNGGVGAGVSPKTALSVGLKVGADALPSRSGNTRGTPGNNRHAPSEIGVDAFQADRSPTHMYRTAPLAGLWTHQKGGFYHDGRFATLRDVLDHDDSFFKLALTGQQETDLVEYLKSL
jgi:hypothetical protein